MKVTGQIEYEDGSTTQFEISSESDSNWVQWASDPTATAGRSCDVLDALSRAVNETAADAETNEDGS